jgi:hypothetical protein
MKHKTARLPWNEMRSGPEGRAMAERNRAREKMARAAGSSTYVREGFCRGDDDVVRRIKTQAQVPPPNDQEGVDHHDRPRTGRAPRRATNIRRRGSRRSPSRRSSERSGDSGDDGPSDEPPSRRRLCACCGREIPSDRGPRAKYIDEAHAGRDRKRRQRERDRARDVRPALPKTADGKRMEEMPPGEWERLLRLATCRCNGHHILAPPDDPPGPRCVKCGRLRPEEGVVA